jgi:hypothetical protein
MRNRALLTLLVVAFISVYATAQNSVATYTLPATGGTPQWALIGSFSAGQAGHTVMITAYIHSGFNASVGQDSTYLITFNTSNGASVDANGFAGDGSWYSVGYNNAITAGNIKWVANAAGINATAFGLYIYLPAYSANSQYTVSVDTGATWANIGSTGQSDPGAGSSTVAIPSSGFNLPTGNVFIAGNVGIGIGSPQATLDVRGPGGIGVGYGSTLGGVIQGSSNGMLIWGYPTANGPGLPLMLQPTSGNVGIGTTAPGAKLEVDGNVKLTAGSGASITFQDGSVQSVAYTGVLPGGDYADSVDVTGNRAKYDAGDLLVIDPDHPGKFLKSAVPYSTSVAGIFSTKPGTVGRRQTGPKSPDEVPMAMVGIVPTKVTAENGPIHPGDLLVTASMTGYAMKGTDRSRMLGAIVGKALGSLDSGTGVIEVVVTLQ